MGEWWGFVDRFIWKSSGASNGQSNYSTANHGPPPCLGPAASAPLALLLMQPWGTGALTKPQVKFH